MLEICIPYAAKVTKSAFSFRELEAFEPGAFVDVLDGNCLGVIVRDFLGQAAREKICENFWNYEGRYRRGADAPAHYAGAYHYRKKLPDYFDEATAANKELYKLFSGLENPVESFCSALSEAMPDRIVRLANWQGRDACGFVMRSWSDQGVYSLNPHDDEAQCTDPIQVGFEIQDAARAHPLMAVNICLENGQGGRLRMWNMHPSPVTRAMLGLENTGSPYPNELLANVDYFDVQINAGDLYAFDGRFVHAVTQLVSTAKSERATLAFLMAHLGNAETIRWS